MRKLGPHPVFLFASLLAAGFLVACGNQSTNTASSGSGSGSGSPAGTPSGTSGNGSSSAAKTTTQLAVSDAANNRIVLYKAPFTTNEAAGTVIGQAGFTSSSENQGNTIPAANTLSGPTGLAMDSAGNLFVADQFNCRVLIYDPPFANNMNANTVIGQPSFTSPSSPNCVASSPASNLHVPTGVAVDSSGNLWVADSSWGRVTEYQPPFTSGMTASLAIGQTSVNNTFYCNGQNPPPTQSPSRYSPPLPNPTANTLCNPYSAALDAAGDLWVADTDNARIVEYKPPFSTGMAASLELGQPAATAFTTRNSSDDSGESASTLNNPESLAFDTSGNLWVSDSLDCRVLEYAPPFTNGMPAKLVIGQQSMTQSTCGTVNGSTLGTPAQLSFNSSGNLIVVDANSNRVLIFDPPFTSGMSAATVLGQQNLTSNGENQGGYTVPAANTLYQPWGVLPF